jgi:acetyl esterase/lipase
MKHKAQEILILILSFLFFCFTPAIESRAALAAQSAGQEKAITPQPDAKSKQDAAAADATKTSPELHGPIRYQKDDQPEFSREVFRTEWREGDPIDLYVIRPHGVEKPPAVLYLYSYPSETDRFMDNNYCRRITSGGYAAIGFVSALTGQRYHSRPMKQWFVSEIDEAIGTSVQDVRMILDYLAKRGDFEMTRIGMFGAGSGGSIAVLAAAADSRIKAIDLLDPWGDWPDWMAKSSLIPEKERPMYATPEFLKKAAPFDPVTSFDKLGSRPVRIQEVMDDDVTPAECKQKIDAAAGKSAKIVHFGDSKALFASTTGGRLFEWLKDELKPKAAKQAAAD